jgi:predicted peptidase
MITHLLASVLTIALAFGFQPGTGAQPESGASSTEIIDLSMNVGDQEYACKVVINEAAKKGGAAILFLHGYGECGTDGNRQLKVGLPKHAAENPEDWPFVLIVPQKPIHNTEWEDHEKALLSMLDEAESKELFDPERLAITGLSQGGHGTVMLASMHPERFVAAAPVCGYIRPIFDEDRNRIHHPDATPETPEFVEVASKIATMPVWIYHGDADRVIPASESRSLHEALEANDADVRYTELEGVNHNAWDDAYTDDELIGWFKQHLGVIEAAVP